MAGLRAWVAAVSMLLVCPYALAQDSSVSEVLACARRNFPEKSSTQTVEFTATDRTGYQKVSRATIHVKKMDDGLRRVVTRFSRPLDIRGSALLMVENDNTEMWIYNPEMRNTKRLSARASMGNLFGTDFSYEDFRRLQGLNRPGENMLKADSVVDGRPVWVVETQPAAEEQSSYSRVLSYIDVETCVTLRSESYERSAAIPRKVLEADSSQLRQTGGIWIAHDMIMRDVLDETMTRLVIEDLEVDVEIDDKCFLHSRLGRNKGC
jgi:outer membrane lipoprotein-sorting protein